MLARRSGQHIFRSWMERQLTYFPCRSVDLRDGVEILRNPFLCAPPEESILCYFPDEDVAVFTTRGDDIVVKGRPSSIEDCGGVTTREGYNVGEFVGEVVPDRVEGGGEGKDGECATAGGVPVYADVVLERWIIMRWR